MAAKSKNTKTTAPKKVVEAKKEISDEVKMEVEENTSLKESVENIVVEETQNNTSEVIEENKKEDEKEKNTNLFQTMKDIIWF